MKNRILFMDILRVLACALVVCMHSPMSVGGIGWFNVGLSYLCAPGLVLFFIISGGLLLPTEIGTWEFLNNRLKKVIFPLITFIGIHIIVRVLSGKPVAIPRDLLSIPFSTSGHVELWFIYVLIGLYLLSPIISKWIVSARKTELQFYLSIWAITLCFPILKIFLKIDQSESGLYYYFAGYIGYYILGYYLKRYAIEMNLWLWLFLGLLSYLTLPICKLYFCEVSMENQFWYLSIFVATMAVAMYLAIFHLFGNREYGRCGWLIKLTSNLTFGIYLIHVLVLEFLVWELPFIKGIQNYIIQTGLIALLTFLISGFLAYGISWLPGSKYIIGYCSRKKNK